MRLQAHSLLLHGLDVLVIPGGGVAVEVGALEVGVLHALVSVDVLLVAGGKLSLGRTGLRAVFRGPLQCRVQPAALDACRPYCGGHTLIRVVEIKHGTACSVIILRRLLLLPVLVHVNESVLS